MPSCPPSAFGQQGATQKFANIVSLMTTGEPIAGEGEWAGVIAEIERLQSADKVVISSPVWNFGMPYPLKHYIDLICQPGATFSMNEKGEYIGMVTGKPLQLIISSGSEYPDRFPQADDGTKTNFLTAHLRHVFGMMGFEDIAALHVAPTDALGPDEGAKAIASAIEKAQEGGAKF
jgi:FMN-dependent NADH-azoreductase